ncbi:MAG: glycosyltransferase [Candidatus Eremiobacteraeota bacterium]|nr:glycosyltransferase [Candidatus Eremiobacteraeota bacterium]
MDFSIIIPVFNKADLTKRCLDALPATIADAGTGEVIVVDNASSDHTARVLDAYPWIRLIRNEENRGFSGANNQAARVAQGDFLILLNNDTEPWEGWLRIMLEQARKPGVGAVGARLLYPDRSCQHGGVVVMANPFGRLEAMPYHHNFMVPFENADVRRTQDVQMVTGACLLTPRALYEELGGLDERYWNGYEDIDYCLKVREKGLRVVYAGDATLYHFESQSGVQRFRKAAWNTELLQRRWHGTFQFDSVEKNLPSRVLRHLLCNSQRGLTPIVLKLQETPVIVHSAEPANGRDDFERELRRTVAPIGRIVWATGDDALAQARAAMELRGVRFAAFVHGAARLEENWLDELIRQVASTPSAAAATYAEDLPLGENVATLGADGRCTLVALYAIPQHERLERFDTIEGSVADLLLRVLKSGAATRGAGKKIATLPAPAADASFERVHGRTLRSLADTDQRSIEAFLTPRRNNRGLVSIVTLSWNAPLFTRTALESIAKYTSEPYEVIVVDNGSGAETIDMLRAIDDPHVRVVYNETNRGFGGGNNDGIARARGEYIVVLNNDVIVTEGWLDALLEPFTRIPNVGVTAPRTNHIVGNQQVIDATYQSVQEMHAYAAERRKKFAGRGFLTDRAIGFCLCIDRRVIDEIGGFDERFVMGNFEDDDFSMRVRAAGYQIYVCDNSFIHHFGSQSFIANNVDYASTMESNWVKFAEKWGRPKAYPKNGYEPTFIYVNGFDRDRHYAAIPSVPSENDTPVPDAPLVANDVVFVASVDSESAWGDASQFVRRYLQAFDAHSPVTLMIGTAVGPSAETLGKRVLKLLEKLGIPEERSADIAISDEENLNGWSAGISARVRFDIDQISDQSPSALRRLVQSVQV